MDELKELFKKLGYNDEEYDEIVNAHGVIVLNAETLAKRVENNYNFLISLGYTQEEIIKMTKSLPAIYRLSIENIKQKIEDMKELGYTQEEVIKITKSCSGIYSHNIENIKQKIEDMKELGYTQEEVVKITKNSPSIYSLSIENIKQKIEDIKELGYTQEEVIKMTKGLPSIYCLSIENIKQKIEDMKILGYTQEEVIKITKSLPAIYGYSIENIKQKIEFYDSINLHSLAVVDSKNLMQSTKLSYARYQFFKEKGIKIDEKNHKKLFVAQKQFERQYGITKQEILERYPYEEEQSSEHESTETKSTQELGRETRAEQRDVETIRIHLITSNKNDKELLGIYSYSIENIKQKIEDMKELGYTQEEVVKITNNSPSIYTYSIENIKQKIEDMKELGYTQEVVIKMAKSLPAIYTYSIENIKQKIEDMEELGYTQEEVIKMTKGFPSIYGLSIENIKQKIEDIKELGYTQQEVIKMTKGLPTIYGLSIENMKQKIKFYDSINLHSLAVMDAKKLMQSTKLSYARYQFFEEKGIKIDEKNYKKLFVGQKQFERQYGITKQEILEIYPYEEEQSSEHESKETKSTQDLGQETRAEQGDVETTDKMIRKIADRIKKIKETKSKEQK